MVPLRVSLLAIFFGVSAADEDIALAASFGRSEKIATAHSLAFSWKKHAN